MWGKQRSAQVDNWMRTDKGQGLIEVRDPKPIVRLLQQLACACALTLLALARAPIAQLSATADFSVQRIGPSTVIEAPAHNGSRGRRSQATALEPNDSQSRAHATGDDLVAVALLDSGVEIPTPPCRCLAPFGPVPDCAWVRRLSLRAPRARAPPQRALSTTEA